MHGRSLRNLVPGKEQLDGQGSRQRPGGKKNRGVHDYTPSPLTRRATGSPDGSRRARTVPAARPITSPRPSHRIQLPRNAPATTPASAPTISPTLETLLFMVSIHSQWLGYLPAPLPLPTSAFPSPMPGFGALSPMSRTFDNRSVMLIPESDSNNAGTCAAISA